MEVNGVIDAKVYTTMNCLKQATVNSLYNIICNNHACDNMQYIYCSSSSDGIVNDKSISNANVYISNDKCITMANLPYAISWLRNPQCVGVDEAKLGYISKSVSVLLKNGKSCSGKAETFVGSSNMVLSIADKRDESNKYLGYDAYICITPKANSYVITPNYDGCLKLKTLNTLCTPTEYGCTSYLCTRNDPVNDIRTWDCVYNEGKADEYCKTGVGIVFCYCHKNDSAGNYGYNGVVLTNGCNDSNLCKYVLDVTNILLDTSNTKSEHIISGYCALTRNGMLKGTMPNATYTGDKTTTGYNVTVDTGGYATSDSIVHKVDAIKIAGTSIDPTTQFTYTLNPSKSSVTISPGYTGGGTVKMSNFVSDIYGDTYVRWSNSVSCLYNDDSDKYAIPDPVTYTICSTCSSISISHEIRLRYIVCPADVNNLYNIYYDLSIYGCNYVPIKANYSISTTYYYLGLGKSLDNRSYSSSSYAGVVMSNRDLCAYLSLSCSVFTEPILLSYAIIDIKLTNLVNDYNNDVDAYFNSYTGCTYYIAKLEFNCFTYTGDSTTDRIAYFIQFVQ